MISNLFIITAVNLDGGNYSNEYSGCMFAAKPGMKGVPSYRYKGQFGIKNLCITKFYNIACDNKECDQR